MAILVTGGTGYIGSHTCIALLEAGYDIAVIDNFANSHRESPVRVRDITGKTFPIHDVDLTNREAVERVLSSDTFEAVIHFAGFKAVGESVVRPLKYYQNNVAGTLVLLEAMQTFDIKRMVFSSSATVYGAQGQMPLTESMPLMPINPYGRTKLMLEMILQDVAASRSDWSIAMLRYFNPVGAHKSGQIGEDPNGIPNNLFPYISQVAVGKLERLTVHGDDYETLDGTCIRDYIHVMDLASGHVKALEYVMSTTGADAFNLGTGHGQSVFECIRAFEEASGVKVPNRVGPRRAGDSPVSYADVTKAQRLLGWKAKYTLLEMCRDAWRWQSMNPRGYANLGLNTQCAPRSRSTENTTQICRPFREEYPLRATANVNTKKLYPVNPT